jgi:hypothetical protein
MIICNWAGEGDSRNRKSRINWGNKAVLGCNISLNANDMQFHLKETLFIFKFIAVDTEDINATKVNKE